MLHTRVQGEVCSDVSTALEFLGAEDWERDRFTRVSTCIVRCGLRKFRRLVEISCPVIGKFIRSVRSLPGYIVDIFRD